ncbi:hypothetical protein [Oscillatoria sp. FACHB-1406]|uniref:hypothetical protein n=1 Tax=Oscillatoria sp. FACHB-1406 TaxID=2692846 RepID=UPI0016878BB8|nr:hypothetical protein [Oscillatoria sp. FACHB-1406]MBD2578695.1 hypothetical protein [Oscillatoria sp. FACHB-1406]
MNQPITKVLFRISIWLAAEILLNFLGLDNLADYSEFIFERNVVVFNAYPL